MGIKQSSKKMMPRYMHTLTAVHSANVDDVTKF